MNVPIAEWQQVHQAPLQRCLPGDGRVMVQVGDRVQPDDIVATITETNPPSLVPIAAGLGVPQAQVGKYLVKSVNDLVQRGEVVAAKKGFFGTRELHAPDTGRIVAIEAGVAVIQAEPTTRHLRALAPGQVSAIVDKRGVVLTVRGVVLRGLGISPGEVWGRMVPWNPIDHGLPADSVVTLMGYLDLSTAQEMAGRVRGVVAGAVSLDVVGWLNRQSPPPLGPVLALEGAGSVEPPNWRGRAGMAGQVATLIVPDIATRPGAPATLIVAHTQSRGEAPPASGEQFVAGSPARTIAGARVGSRGVITSLPRQPVRLESSHVAIVAVGDFGGVRRNEPIVNLLHLADDNS